MKNEKAIKAKLESYCEWCIAQGGDCHAKLNGCSIFEVLALLGEPEKPIRDTDKSPVTCPKCKRVDGLMWDARP
ncbi:hypothetical protein LCGC14_2458410, partial [marine sediment metagenome]